uniref:Uncharacterized protein n=1 Tax=Tanacetum cinerariifolium TaxID=118510 RepID=A0A699L8S4_TANCI|nr:hypothetical protein [Tanacetum cinerariifolium]
MKSEATAAISPAPAIVRITFPIQIDDKKKCDVFWWIDPEISSPWAKDQLERLQIKHDGLVSKFEQSEKSCRFTKILIACMVVVFMVMKM